MAKPPTHRCMWSPAKRGDFEVCSSCNDRFPCQGNTCGHLDCIEHRKKDPQCHFCNKTVRGTRGEEWGTGVVHGHTRSFHYACRDEHASPAERAITGAPFNP